MYHCPKCDKSVHPTQTLTPFKGFVNQCPFCGGGVVEVKSDEPVEPKPALRVVNSAKVEPKATPAAHACHEPVDVLSMAKARLVEVRNRIAELRAYEIEESMLERMVSAAESSPLRAVK